MQPDASRTPSLARDGLRNLVSLAIAAAVSVIALFGYNALTPARFSVDAVALTTFVFWIAYSLAFLILTQATFGRADARTLRTWLGRDLIAEPPVSPFPPRRRSGQYWP